MRRETIKAWLVLGGLYVLLALFLVWGGGCASTPAATTQPAATAAQRGREVRIGSILEARKAYSAAEDVFTEFVVAGSVPHATALAIRDDFRAARKSIDAADALVVGGSDVSFSAALADAWSAIEKVRSRGAATKPAK